MLVQFAEAARIACISEHQLKEWCMRRALITPEVQPRGRGHSALFGWRSLLALRVLSLIHTEFGGTVAHWGPIVENFRRSIEHASFPALFGQYAISDGRKMVLGQSLHQARCTGLIVALDEHLLAVSRGLSHEDGDGQLSLLPPMLVTR
jgi:hypothetical protein